jgi:hypothetical protein
LAASSGAVFFGSGVAERAVRLQGQAAAVDAAGAFGEYRAAVHLGDGLADRQPEAVAVGAASPRNVARDRQLRVRVVRCRTVANVDSIGFVVRICCQCSAGKS